MIRVFIADDHPLIRQGLRTILADAPDISLEGEAEDGFETIDLLRRSEVDVLVLDISMPKLSGLDVIKRLTDEGSTVQILVLSVHSMKQYAVRVLRMGASGYLMKDAAEDELIEAVRTVASGKKYISPDLALTLADFVEKESWNSPLSRLSNREYEILKSIVSGKSMKETAYELNITVQTVSTYRSRLLQKLDLKTNADLIKFGYEQGIL